MPSRYIRSPSPPPATLPISTSGESSPTAIEGNRVSHHAGSTRFIQPLSAAGAGAGFSIFVTLAVCFCKISRKRHAAADLADPSKSTSPRRPPLHEFSYLGLRRATASFSPSNRLGQGGFGSVFRGTVASPSVSAARDVAVKVMDSGSLQGEREFQNELFFATKLDSPSVVSVIGFSHDRKRRRMLLVYELMENGNLQDALIHRRCPELMEWNRRFLVAIDIAKAVEYLHSLDPPVIHGDIKPSNILLDQLFSAKIADFGLARMKSDQVEITVAPESDGLKLDGNGGRGGGLEECGSVAEEEESVITNTTGYEEFNFCGVGQSPESVSKVPGSVTGSPETVEAAMASPSTTAISVSPETEEKVSVLDGADSDKDAVNVVKRGGKEIKSNSSTKDWWWKQDGGLDGGKVKVKDYVMEWIGSEVKKERPNSDWMAATTASASSKKPDKKKSSKRLEWWISLDEEKEKKKMKKRRPVREWWKEEYCEELAWKKKEKKKKKKSRGSELYTDDISVDQWWSRDEELHSESEMKKNRKKRRGGSNSITGMNSSIDWWLDGLSGELWRARRNSHDSVSMSGDLTRSYGVSSTPSMRGTVCYVAPEYGNIEDMSEKSDVYSYGVLMLVLVSGRRPIEVTGITSEIHRANLMSWARRLARRGKLLDLVDEKLEQQSLDQDQALLCIKVALQCLQKSPVSRPSMKEVVGMLTGELSPPELPAEFSPSNQNPFKTRRKRR